jgi:hypothetical protein
MDFVSGNFLKSVKPFLFYIEEVLLRVCWEKWSQMRLQVPLNYGLFGTLWTTVVHNPSFSHWHLDLGDFGLAALLWKCQNRNCQPKLL